MAAQGTVVRQKNSASHAIAPVVDAFSRWRRVLRYPTYVVTTQYCHFA